MDGAALAFFRRDSDSGSCSAALSGALEVMESLASVSLSDTEFRAGIALHYGELSYGSVSAGHHPDLAIVGPAFNLLSRIQNTCRTTGRPLLMSARFAELLGEEKTIETTHHARGGFTGPVRLHTLTNISERQMGTYEG
jgi:adenylate cyclase